MQTMSKTVLVKVPIIPLSKELYICTEFPARSDHSWLLQPIAWHWLQQVLKGCDVFWRDCCVNRAFTEVAVLEVEHAAQIESGPPTGVVLSRICAAPRARLGHLSFEGQGAFAS